MYSSLYGMTKSVLTSLRISGKGSKQTPRYNKSLVYKLMCNHQNLFHLFVELRLTAQHRNQSEALYYLDKFKKLHNRHLTVEKRNLYPVVRQNLSTENRSTVFIDTLQHQFKNDVSEIHAFCDYWYDNLQVPGNILNFKVALDNLGKMLDKLVTEKEMKLYPLYNEIPKTTHSTSDELLHNAA